MNEQVALIAEYTEALRDYLLNGSEEALSRAYEFGRRAVEGGILELASLHHMAISSLALNGDEQVRTRITRAADFFAEVVSPLEMALRSYRDSTSALIDLNERLQIQNIDLARAKEAADAANSELEAFSYSVAHDLRAPLRAIDGFSEILVEDHGASLDADARECVEHVRRSAQRMSELIEGLLGLSRVTRGELERMQVDLGALAAAAVERLRNAEPGRKVNVDIDPRMKADGDPRLLGALIDNLIGNAWKYSGKRVDATIAAGIAPDTDDGETVYFVRDNGAGFDPAQAHRLFGAFQRLHDAKEFEGTGIGLATVQRIVRRHGGRIWAEGAVNRGATFWFTLGNRRGRG